MHKRQFAVTVVTFRVAEIGVTEPLVNVLKEVLFALVVCTAFVFVPTLYEMVRGAVASVGHKSL